MEGFHLLLATPKNTTSERGAPDSKSMYKLSVSTLNQENALRLPQKRSGESSAGEGHSCTVQCLKQSHLGNRFGRIHHNLPMQCSEAPQAS